MLCKLLLNELIFEVPHREKAMEIPGNEFRINKNKGVSGVTPKPNKPGVGDTSAASQVAGSEHIALSAKAKGIQKALETVQATPDIRIEKINRIKTEIAEGRFQVSSEAVAEKILGELLSESEFLE